MCAKFQPDSSAVFFKEENQRFICREIWVAGLPLPKATKVADESDTQFHSSNTISLEKNVGCV
jgi:hypothetical protein